MKDIPNKTLAYILIIALIISVTGTFISITKLRELFTPAGKVSGYVNVTILSRAEITMTDTIIEFGSGYVNETCSNCTIASNGTTLYPACCVGMNATINWSYPINDNLTIENTGSTNVVLYIASYQNASEFIGGTTVSPSFQIKVEEGEPGSCYGNLLIGWQEVNKTDDPTTDPGTQFCDNFTFTDTNDTLVVFAKLRIPRNAPAGTKTATIVATAEVAE